MTVTDPAPQLFRGSPFKLDLSRLPALFIKPAARVGGTVMALLGLFFVGVGIVVLWGLVMFDGSFDSEEPLLVLFFAFCFIGIGVSTVKGAFRHMLVQKRIVFGPTTVTFEARSPFGTVRWSDLYSAFRGVQLRKETIYSRYASRSYWLIELAHRDPRRTVLLMHREPGNIVDAPALRRELNRYAQLLQVPVVAPPLPWWRHLFRHGFLRRLGDPWPTAWNPGVKPKALGPGSIHTFNWYFTQESTVGVTTIQEVVEWLIGCQYVPDEDIFGQRDYWQHPHDFERLRQGDCEDHALWAWRKLIELGIEARLFIGLWASQVGRPAALHAWVTYESDGVAYLVETTRKRGDAMIDEVAERRADYCPHFSVGGDLRIRSHRGYVLRCFGWEWDRAAGSPAKAA